jgi:uncharacterized protein (TIGR00299 family) protein
MKTLYLDIFSGLSGDMLIGALLDLGIDAHRFEHELEKLGLNGEFHLHVRRASKQSIEGTKFDVHLAHGHEHEHEHSHAGKPAEVHSHSHPHKHGHKHEHHDHAHEHTHEHHDHEHDCDDDHEHHEHDHAHDHHGHEHGRNFTQIKELIGGSTLSSWVKERSIAVFHRIAVAEGKIHGLPPEQVHFHEVGAVDSIVDIVGACIGLEMLDKPRVLSSTAVEGTGFINCAHGRFPIPAPATLSILGARGIALSQCEEPQELLTPTGAALLAEFAESFGPMQGLVAEKIGFGLGTRENKTRPNVVRAVLGTASEDVASHDWETDTIAVLETNIDDLSGEILGCFVDRAFAAGALDVFHTPVQMKKNRPGILLTVLCAENEADKLTELMLRETSSFGVRRSTASRRKLRREFVKVHTAYGEATIKLGRLDGKIIHASPEFESCRVLAEQGKLPIQRVYEAALKAFGTGNNGLG